MSTTSIKLTTAATARSQYLDTLKSGTPADQHYAERALTWAFRDVPFLRRDHQFALTFQDQDHRNAVHTIGIGRFASLATAVHVAGLDLSYNRPLALEHIQRTERDPRVGFAGALVDDDNTVYTLHNFGRHGRTLNVFDPFCSVLDDRPLKLIALNHTNLQLIYVGTFPRKFRDSLNQITNKHLGAEVELFIA